MCKIERILYPVGHGAFFVEKILGCVIVYDCGSRNHEILSKQIKSAFSNGEVIDALFISHFDTDHVNGIIELEEYMTPNTKVYLPFYYSNLTILYSQDVQIAIKLVKVTLDKKGIRPIQIKYGPLQEFRGYRRDDINNRNRDDDNIGEPHEDEDGNLIIESGTRIPLPHIGGNKIKLTYPFWEYVPFMIHDDQKIFEAFKKEALAKGLDLNHLDKLTSKQINDLRKIYHQHEVFQHTINENTMILLSHATRCFPRHWFYIDLQINQNCYFQCDCRCLPYYCNCRFCFCDGSCLYTGDSVLKRSSRLTAKQCDYDIFLDRLRNYTPKILLYQIPHHGSSNNSNLLSLSDNMSEMMFCNYSSAQDPHQNTFMIQKVRPKVLKKIFDITEDPKSKLTMNIFIH